MKLTPEGYIEVNISTEMLNEATRKANELGCLNNSIRHGQGNVTGFLGELALVSLNPNFITDNSYDYDVRYKDFKIDVKTKDRTVKPKPHYECSIASYNVTQECDLYVFVSLLRVDNVYRKAYILGCMKKDDYYKQARFLKKGTVDPSNNFTVRADCWNLPIKDLKPVKKRKVNK